MRYTYRYRSFFWPAILILGGVVALLVNTGQIPVDRLYQLVNLWPVVLVVIGLELIIRRTVHGLTGDVAAALIVLIAVVGAAAYVTVGPPPPRLGDDHHQRGSCPRHLGHAQCRRRARRHPARPCFGARAGGDQRRCAAGPPPPAE